MQLAVAFLFLVGSSHASACVVPRMFFDESIVDQAHIIIRGRLVAYELLYSDRLANPVAARLTFEVAETYRGDHRATHDAIWYNSTFALPDDLSRFSETFREDAVAGLIPAGYDVQPGSVSSLTVGRTKNIRFPELPRILQTPCTPPFMSSFDRMEPMLRRQGVLD